MSLLTSQDAGRDSAVVTDISARTVRWIVVLLVLLGAFLRFYRLGAQSLWVDELLTISAANIGGTLGRGALSNIQGPLHAVLIHFIARLSTSEVALRGLSALAGTATIPVVYLLGRDMAGRRTGLVAATLITVSPFAVWYSQEVRNYALLIFLASVSTLAAWRIMVAGTRSWRSYAVTMTLALYSNLSAAFLWLAHALFGLGRLARMHRVMKWAATCVIIGLLVVPLMMALANWVEVDSVSERVVVAPLADEGLLLRGATTFSPMAIPYSFYTFVYGYSLGPSSAELHTQAPLRAFVPYLWFVIPAGLLAAAVFVIGFTRLWKDGAAGRLVTSVVAVPFAAAAGLALLNIKPFNVRYVAVVLPVVVIVLAAGLASQPLRRRAWLWGGVVLFSLWSLSNYFFVPEYSREDLRGAAHYVASAERPGDVVLVPSVGDVFAYYFDGAAGIFAVYRSDTATEERLTAAVQAGTTGRARLWFVNSRLWRMDEQLRTPGFLDERYRELDRHELAGATVVLYDLNEPPAAASEDGPLAEE